MQSRPPSLGAFGKRMILLAAPRLLSDAEKRLLAVIEERTRKSWRPQARLVQEKASGVAPQVIIAGWACQARELSDGRRQIIQLLAPGDIVGLPSRLSPILCTVVALTPMKTVDARELHALLEQPADQPALGRALQLVFAEIEAFQVQSLVRLGRMTAYERVSHLLLELNWRLSQRGLTQNGEYVLPLTQEAIADTLGLSVVHVNRTLQQMRREKTIAFAQGKVALLDMPKLESLAEFRAPSRNEGG